MENIWVTLGGGVDIIGGHGEIGIVIMVHHMVDLVIIGIHGIGENIGADMDIVIGKKS